MVVILIMITLSGLWGLINSFMLLGPKGCKMLFRLVCIVPIIVMSILKALCCCCRKKKKETSDEEEEPPQFDIYELSVLKFVMKGTSNTVYSIVLSLEDSIDAQKQFYKFEGDRQVVKRDVVQTK